MRTTQYLRQPVPGEAAVLRKKKNETHLKSHFNFSWSLGTLFINIISGVLSYKCHVSKLDYCRFQLYYDTADTLKKRWHTELHTNVIIYFYFYFFGHTTCETLVPWLGIEPMSSALEVWSLNHWTTREVPW